MLAHFERQLHGGVYPVGENGLLVDEVGRPHLEAQLTKGVELLRLVCYQMARVDDFAFAVQALYEERGAAEGGGETEGQRELVREVYDALGAPLDERLRMLHAWLEPKEDDAHSAPFGDRGRWADGADVPR